MNTECGTWRLRVIGQSPSHVINQLKRISHAAYEILHSSTQHPSHYIYVVFRYSLSIIDEHPTEPVLDARWQSSQDSLRTANRKPDATDPSTNIATRKNQPSPGGKRKRHDENKKLPLYRQITTDPNCFLLPFPQSIETPWRVCSKKSLTKTNSSTLPKESFPSLHHTQALLRTSAVVQDFMYQPVQEALLTWLHVRGLR
ncbi:hypothetical protein LZ30DRAFT_251034 [Colletotrichum cereale]|nr:hypothetical protein LZ30DRAFT_251034 [Colletotrichum cereale]